jgi:hypothetical protein
MVKIVKGLLTIWALPVVIQKYFSIQDRESFNKAQNMPLLKGIATGRPIDHLGWDYPDIRSGPPKIRPQNGTVGELSGFESPAIGFAPSVVPPERSLRPTKRRPRFQDAFVGYPQEAGCPFGSPWKQMNEHYQFSRSEPSGQPIESCSTIEE